jgi:holin-like protein
MLAGLTLLLLFQCAGEALVHGLKLPFPGPVLGMLLLFVTLTLRRRPIFDGLRQAGRYLQHFAAFCRRVSA